jgi:hypothetical protein
MKEVKGCAKILTEMVYVSVAQTIVCRATSAFRVLQDMQTEQGTNLVDLIPSVICALKIITSRLSTRVRLALEHRRVRLEMITLLGP